MMTAEEIAQKAYTGGDPDIEDIVAVMKEYAKEILKDYDNWKIYKTPHLVEQYIKEKGL